ncbi:MAG: ParB/RepB/Spo0J family partition protein [Candidatus Doudnabacteria bacterium]|nr:ParB/RepB/Spo0J family partition protein [Candidatus Doudnabacteria bacterium]
MAATERQITAIESGQIDQVRRIPRMRIRRFADQPRTYFDAREMNDLAASIEEIGQQTPVIVKAITGDPKHDYELVDGERRWIACGMVGVGMMLAWVKRVHDSEEQFISSVVGNFGRSGHTALEIAQAIDRIRKSKRMEGLPAGEQISSIAKIFARSEPWVYQHIAILRLHPEVQAMMAPTLPDEQRMSHSLGVFISSLHQDLQIEIAKKVVAKKMNINQARVYARQAAEEAGVQAGTAKRPHLTGDYYKSLQRFIQKTQEGAQNFLSPPTLVALQKRYPKDLALIATEIEQCAARLNQLRAALTGKPSGTR